MAQAPARAGDRSRRALVTPLPAMVNLTGRDDQLCQLGRHDPAGAVALDPVFVRRRRPLHGHGDRSVRPWPTPMRPRPFLSRVTSTLTLRPANCTPSHALGMIRHGVDPIRPGQAISFTFTVTNTGSIP
ncbi:MAG: hypothetical protein R2854_13910 [Caldilineaceae bacterium]